MTTTTLIIGANRGIGLELAKQLAAKSHQVVGTYRQSAGGLAGLKSVESIGNVDIADPKGIETLRSAIGDRTFDNVMIVSGILRPSSLSEPNYDDVLAQFVVNAMGPLRAAVALYKNINGGGRLAILTSRMGSMADNGSGGAYGYRMSKAAVNAAGVSLANDLRSRNISVALFHPGFVRTEMTGNNGHLDADESARLLIERLEGMTIETTGAFLHANGDLLPW